MGVLCHFHLTSPPMCCCEEKGDTQRSAPTVAPTNDLIELLLLLAFAFTSANGQKDNRIIPIRGS